MPSLVDGRVLRRSEKSGRRERASWTAGHLWFCCLVVAPVTTTCLFGTAGHCLVLLTLSCLACSIFIDSVLDPVTAAARGAPEEAAFRSALDGDKPLGGLSTLLMEGANQASGPSGWSPVCAGNINRRTLRLKMRLTGNLGPSLLAEPRHEDEHTGGRMLGKCGHRVPMVEVVSLS